MDFVITNGLDLAAATTELEAAVTGYSGGSRQLRRIGSLEVYSTDPTRLNAIAAGDAGRPAVHYLFDGQFSFGNSYFHGLLSSAELPSRIDALVDGAISALDVNAGVFVAGRIDDTGLLLRTDHLGQYPIYYAQLGERFVVANTIQLVSAVLQSTGLSTTPSLVPCIEGLVLGGSIGTTTQVNGVSRVPFGHHIVARPRLSFVRDGTADHELDYDEIVQQAHRSLVAHVNAVAAAVDVPRHVATDITGGSDSRAVLSLLLASEFRHEFKGRCITRFPNPDANVAGALMTRFNILVSAAPIMIDSLDPPTFERLQGNSLASGAAFGGGSRLPSGPFPSIATPEFVHFTGSFGEIGGATRAGDFVALTEAQGYSAARAAEVMVSRRRRQGALELVTPAGQELVQRNIATALAELEDEGISRDQLQAEFYLRARCRSHFGIPHWLSNKTKIRPDPLASAWLVAARRALPRHLHRKNKVILDLILAAGPQGRELAFLPMADARWEKEIVPPAHAEAWRGMEVVKADTAALTAMTGSLLGFSPVVSAALRQAFEDPAVRAAYQRRRQASMFPKGLVSNIRFGNEATIAANQAIVSGLLDAAPRDSDMWQLLDREALIRYAHQSRDDFKTAIEAGAFSQAACGMTWVLQQPSLEGVKEIGQILVKPTIAAAPSPTASGSAAKQTARTNHNTPHIMPSESHDETSPAPGASATTLPTRMGDARLTPEERWLDAKKTFGHANPLRARQVADKIIAFGVTSILDIGCGNMKLGELLGPAGVKYVPADVVPRTPESLIVNLDQAEVPRVDVECTVLIGVLEFLHDPLKVLTDISRKYRRVLLTLSPLQTIHEQVWHGRRHTITCSHVSALSLNEFKRFFVEHFVIEDIDVISTGQYLILGQSRALAHQSAEATVRQQERLENQRIGIEDNSIDFDSLAKGFEAHIFKSVPFHSMFLRTTALLASAVVRPGTICVDLGCSTGRLARLLRRHLKDTVPVEIMAIDNSPEMIAEARRKQTHPLTKYVLANIETVELPSSVAFVSCLFTLQFLDFEARKRVLEKICRALDWRGCAVIAEKVVEQDGKQQMTNHYLLNGYKHAMGFSDEEVLSKERAVRSALRPLTRAENLHLFAQAGFERAQVVASAFGWELYLLERGPAAAIPPAFRIGAGLSTD